MYRVLLADDEPMILEGMQCVIQWEELGLGIAGLATDGRAALDLLEAERYDILITDIKMPVMDGLELLRAVRAKWPQMRVIVLSGHDDFHFVKEAARLGIENYLLKPVNEEELLSTLLLTVNRLDGEARQKIRTTQDISIIRDNLLLRWVTSQITMQELAMRFDVLGMEDGDARYTAVVVHAEDLVRVDGGVHSTDAGPIENSRRATVAVRGHSAPLADSGNATHTHVLAACRRALEGIPVFVFPNLQLDVVLLFRERRDEPNRLRIAELAERCVTRILQMEGIQATALAGSTMEGPESVSASYKEAISLLDHVMLSRGSPVLSYAEVSERMNRMDVDFHVDYPKLRQLVLDMDAEGICVFTDKLFARLSQDPCLSPAFIRAVTMRIGLYIMSTASMVRSAVQVFCDEMDTLFAEASQHRSIEELKGWIRNVAETSVSLLEEEETGYSPAISQVVHYIETNYHGDVALKSIAHALNMNAIYLGQLFKNETGQMFSAYVNNLRIEKAKVMLLGSKTNVVDVGAKVGYASNNHFYTVFRKMTGFSPTEFRRLNL